MARLTALVDPHRLEVALNAAPGDLHPDAAYIVRKQLEEADLVLVNKTEALTATETSVLRKKVEDALPGRDVRCISALAGLGVEEWLAAAQGEGVAGGRILDVDYDRYAAGEAALGWLNTRRTLACTGPAADWQAFCGVLMGALRDALDQRMLPIGHLKLLLSTDEGHLVASLTRAGGAISCFGRTGPSREADLVLNARVETTPDDLESIVRRALAAAAGSDLRVTIQAIRALRPGRPVPTFRYTEAVG